MKDANVRPRRDAEAHATAKHANMRAHHDARGCIATKDANVGAARGYVAAKYANAQGAMRGAESQ